MCDSHERAQLIAPCGMDCAVCGAYLAYSHRVPRKRGAITHCTGCRIRGKKCGYLKGHCELLTNGQIEFCFECTDYPCKRLRHLDERYRNRWQTSLIDNLELIRQAGPEALIERQQNRFGCATCGALRSVHNQRCYVCEEIHSWKE